MELIDCFAQGTARVDWLSAMALGKTSLTPYVSLTYLKTRTDDYIEQGGSFPVMWNQRTDKSTTARLARMRSDQSRKPLFGKDVSKSHIASRKAVPIPLGR